MRRERVTQRFLQRPLHDPASNSSSSNNKHLHNNMRRHHRNNKCHGDSLTIMLGMSKLWKAAHIIRYMRYMYITDLSKCFRVFICQALLKELSAEYSVQLLLNRISACWCWISSTSQPFAWRLPDVTLLSISRWALSEITGASYVDFS